MVQRPARFLGAVAPGRAEAPHLRNSAGVAPFPVAAAAEGLDPVTVDVHGHCVAAAVVRAAERERHHMVDLVGAFDRLPAIPANPKAIGTYAPTPVLSSPTRASPSVLPPIR